MPLLLLALGLGATYYLYQASQTATAVPVEHQIEVPQGELQAIEYFWRPG